MDALKIGYMALSKASWRTEKIAELRRSTLSALRKMEAEIVAGDDLTTTESEAVELCSKFNQADVDVVILHFATFPVGAVIPAVARQTSAPMILLANPERAEPGGILGQNSFCGANMAFHVLKRMDRKFSFVFCECSELNSALGVQLKAAGCAARLRSVRIGLVGGRVPGFYTSNFDELRLRSKFGVGVEALDLIEVVDEAKKITDAEAVKGLTMVKACAAKTIKVSDDELSLAGRMRKAFDKIVGKYRLDGLAVRCWPEFSDIFGIAPCAVIGMLNDSGMPTSCEGDVLGSVTMRVQKSLSDGGTPFFATP